eukprot:IDg11010t1
MRASNTIRFQSLLQPNQPLQLCHALISRIIRQDVACLGKFALHCIAFSAQKGFFLVPRPCTVPRTPQSPPCIPSGRTQLSVVQRQPVDEKLGFTGFKLDAGVLPDKVVNQRVFLSELPQRDSAGTFSTHPRERTHKPRRVRV